MEIHRDQVAVITGAASGLGLALARRCGARGLGLVLADVDREGLAAARRTLDWRWVLGVNLWGVVHGIAAFLPRMRAQTASPSRSGCGESSPPAPSPSRADPGGPA